MSDSGDDGVPVTEHRDLSADERGEREALPGGRAGPGRPPEKPVRRRRGWRTPVAALLIVVGCVLAPLSVVAVWTANQVSDTSRYVANVEPLIKDPAIQNALTDKLTNEIVTQIDVKGLTDQAAAELSQKGLHPDQHAAAGRLRLAGQRGRRDSCTAASTRSSPARGWRTRGHR